MPPKIKAVVTDAFLLVAGMMAAVSLLASAGGQVDPGVQTSSIGGTVQSVVVGGIGWRAGVRPGQVVVALAPADSPGGWRLETDAGVYRIEVSTSASQQLLRQTLPFGLLALGGVVAGATFRRRRRTAEALASGAAVLASVPISLEGDPVLAATLLPAALFLPAVWLGRDARTAAARWGIVGGAGIFLLGWALLRGNGAPGYSVAEDLRAGATIAAGAAIVAIMARGSSRGEGRVMRDRRWLLDAAGLVLAASLVGILVLGGVPLPLVGAAVVLLAVLYPIAWRRVTEALDRLLFADLRDRMSIKAAEEERARLARDLHDAPLQEIAGVIKRLELVPDAQAEGDVLREVAHELRSVASELHPPVLEDLGLMAALRQAAATESGDGLPITVAIDDATGVRRSERPPADVELAVFRIVAEAMNNARAHSRASRITLAGQIGTDRIGLVVEDDGVGMSSARLREAERGGHFGLHSMRRRAELIGAELTIGSAEGSGTRVELRWAA